MALPHHRSDSSRPLLTSEDEACVQVSRGLLKQVRSDIREGKAESFYKAYRQLQSEGLFLMSGIASQVARTIGVDDTRSVYFIKPRFPPSDKALPVVFFMHGYLGIWKRYQGIFEGLEDCIVLSVGTTDLSGLYGRKDIEALFSKQLVFLKIMGLKVDERQLNLIGFSNGGLLQTLRTNPFPVETNPSRSFPRTS